MICGDGRVCSFFDGCKLLDYKHPGKHGTCVLFQTILVHLMIDFVS